MEQKGVGFRKQRLETMTGRLGKMDEVTLEMTMSQQRWAETGRRVEYKLTPVSIGRLRR